MIKSFRPCDIYKPLLNRKCAYCKKKINAIKNGMVLIDSKSYCSMRCANKAEVKI